MGELINSIIGLSVWQDPTLTFFIFVLISIVLSLLIVKGKWLIIIISNKWFGTSFPLNDKKRSCSDCILLMDATRETFEEEKDSIKDSILKIQMDFAEQKMIEVETMFYSKYIENLSKMNIPVDEENKQSAIYYGLMKDTFRIVKDEIRRSFKENGFHQLGGMDFSGYVKARMNVIKALVTQNYINRYPSHIMLITKEHLEQMINIQLPQIEDILFEIYIKAKEIRITSNNKVDELKKQFIAKMDEFSGENNGRRKK